MKPYYEHGGITIYHGNCREILPSLEFDAIVSDPPYGISHRRGKCADRGKGVTIGTAGIEGDLEPFDPSPFLDCENLMLWGANYYADRLPMGRWAAVG